MPHPHNVDTEVNAQYQMRDIVLWGCAAVFAATTAIAAYLIQPDADFTQHASNIPNTENDVDNNTNSATEVDSDAEADTITTGSLPPKKSTKNTDKLLPSSAKNITTSSFGTTVAKRQENADSVRRMREETDQASARVEQTTSSPTDALVLANTENIGPGPIGIDLGTGHSFSILGKRFTAMVNAAPTLFADLSARASIIEHESSIEAHLVVGPVKNVRAARLLCKKIQSRVNTSCAPANYTGRKLKLY